MVQAVYFRDPRTPRDFYGPFTIDQLRDLVRQGRLRRTDQVSIDKQSWLAATDFEPEIFPSSTADWTASETTWQRGVIRAGGFVKSQAIAVWNYLRAVAEFYWTQRHELWQLATDYIPFFKESGNRREIRVSVDDHNEAIYLDGDQWHANLPDCCVVCGNPADCDWNNEQRAVANLTWPLLAPVYGLVLGVVAWIFFWNSEGRWFVPLGLLGGFLIGYRKRGETLVALRFRRCREHLNRIRLPKLRTFRRTLAIGIGDRKVWRRFYYGDQDIETPLKVPPDFSAIVEAKREESSGARPSPPPIPLADSDPGEHD